MLLVALVVFASAFHEKLNADTGTSTRIVNPNQHVRSDPGG
jgi:hypothetical protein